MADVFSLIVHDRTEIFKDIGKKWDSLSNDAQHAVRNKLGDLNKEKNAYLEGIFERSTTTACVICLSTASLEAQKRVWELTKRHFSDLDLNEIWNEFCESLADTAAVVGAGAAVGGTIGGIVTLGPGAIPGAIIGAKVSLAILRTLGLVEAGIDFVSDLTRCCGQLSDGFRLAWSAGLIPRDRPIHERSKRMRQAIELIAQGEFGLTLALFRAVSTALLRSPNKSGLLGKLKESKLGKGFAPWFDGNHDKIKGKLPEDAKGGAGTAAKAPPPAAPRVENPKPGVDTVTQNGEAEKGCAECPLVGAPVSPIFGCKILSGDTELDFALAAHLPLVWQRIYSSAQAKTGWLGQGWWTPISESLYIGHDAVVIQDAHDRRITFSLPQVGHSIYSPSEKITLYRSGPREFEIIDADLERRLFVISTGAHDYAQLVSVVDANGNTIRIMYGPRQLPERIIDSAGREYILAFSEHHGQIRLTSIGKLHQPKTGVPATESDLLVKYDYDDLGDLIAVRNRVGDVMRQFAYRQHIMIEHSQPGGMVSRYDYDEYHSSGKVLRNWTNDGQSWDFRYLQNETIVTDNLGRETRYQFDERKRFIGEVDTWGGVTRRELDQDGNLLSITDPGGHGSSFRYDERGRVIRIETAGSGIGIIYDSRFDKPILITDGMGATTAIRYDSRGNLRSVTNALGHKSTYEYDEQGLPIRLIDARGGIKRLTYNGMGRLTSYTDCSGYTTRYTHDDDGKLLKATDATNNSTTYSYDALGQLESVGQPDGAIQRYEYDNLGRLICYIDPLGNRTSYKLNCAGKPIKRINAGGAVLEYQYDAVCRLQSLTNENGETHHFVFDALDRLIEETTFDARLTRYRYDASGLLTVKQEFGTPPRTQLTRIESHYLRDTAGRLVEKCISRVTGDASADQLRLRYEYDPLGRMIKAVNADSTVSFEYNAVGQLLSEHMNAGASRTSLYHVYDELGNRIQTRLPDGKTLNNLFYGSGHLHQINLDGDIVTDIERDREHRSISYTQGVLTSHLRYDAAGRLLAQVASHTMAGEGSNSVISRHYSYDRGGHLESINDAHNGPKTFTYDALGRMAVATQPSLQERFTFDPAHNLVDVALNSSGQIKGNLVRVFEDKRYTYDAHGNLKEKRSGRHTSISFTWDDAHQLKQTITRSNSHNADAIIQTTTYIYDALGRRIAKTSASGTTKFIWDGNRLLSELKDDVSTTYIYDSLSYVPIARFQSFGHDVPVKIDYLHADQIGTPHSMTNSGGSVIWVAETKAWGSPLHKKRASPSQSDAIEKSMFDNGGLENQNQSIRALGQYYDTETGLHYNRFRYYDPDCGRFISIDPIGLTGGTNGYQYAPNPTGWSDPLGLAKDCACPNKVFPTLSADIARTIEQIKAGGDNLMESTMKTTAGELGILAELKTVGGQLQLDAFTVYAKQGTIAKGSILRDILAGKAELKQAARENGFSEIWIKGQRAANSSSANPGREIDLILKLEN